VKEIAVLHAGGAPQATRAGHVAAMSGCAGAIDRHGGFLNTLSPVGPEFLFL
jgi:hypothetical protein